MDSCHVVSKLIFHLLLLDSRSEPQLASPTRPSRALFLVGPCRFFFIQIQLYSSNCSPRRSSFVDIPWWVRGFAELSGLHVNLLSLCGTVFWTSRVWVCGQSKSTNMSRNVPRGGNSVFRFPSSVRIIFRLLAVSHGFDNHLLRRSSWIFFGGLPCVLLLSQRNFIFRLLATCSSSIFLSGGFRLHFFYVFDFSISIISSFRNFLSFDFILVFSFVWWCGLAYACGREQRLLRWSCWSSSFE